MIYAVELDPKVLSALFALAEREAEFVSFNFFKLAESPRELSTTSTLRRGLEYAFRLAAPLGTNAVWFSVSWQYKREEIIYVNDVVRSIITPPA